MTRSKLLLLGLVLGLLAFSWAEEEAINDGESEEIHEEEQVDFFAQTRHLLLKPDQLPEPLFSQKLPKGFNKALFLIFYDDSENNKVIIEAIISPFLEERRGYFRAAAISCSEFEGTFSEAQKELPFCEGEMKQALPIMVLISPPEYKINPYTKKAATPSIKTFQEEYKQFSKENIEEFVMKKLPDFSTKVEPDKIDEFVAKRPLNSVILLTKKKKVGTLMKAISAEFRNRLQFGVVNVEEKMPSLVEELDIEEFPQFVLIQPDGEKQVYGGSNKLRSLKKYLTPFARDEELEDEKEDPVKDEEPSQTQEEKEPTKYYEEVSKYYEQTTEGTFLDEATGTPQAVLVYLHKEEQDLSTFETEVAKKLRYEFTDFSGMVKTVTIVCNKENESAKTLKAEKCPSFIFLKPSYTGQEKIKKKVNLLKTDSLKGIIEQIKAAYKEDAVPIDDHILNSYLAPFLKWPDDDSEPPKILVIYFHRDESDVRLAFKAITQDPIFKQRFKFITVSEPSDMTRQTFQISKLPHIAGVITIPPEMYIENDHGYRVFTYNESFKFKNMYQFFAQFAGEALKQQQQQQQSIPHVVEEIKTFAEYEQKCKDSLICGIGLLKDDSDDEIAQQLEVLTQATFKIAKGSRVKLMWLNADCHNEFLLSQNIDSTSLPSVVFLIPKQKKISQLIGKFDSDSIHMHIEKLIRGTARNLFPLTKELEIFEKNCEDKYWRQGEQKTQEEIELQNQILRQILEEEKAKKAADKAQESKKKKKKKRKGNKKKPESDL